MRNPERKSRSWERPEASSSQQRPRERPTVPPSLQPPDIDWKNESHEMFGRFGMVGFFGVFGVIVWNGVFGRLVGWIVAAASC